MSLPTIPRVEYCFIFKTLDNFQSLRTESIYFSLIFSRVGSRTLILLMTSVVYDQSENCIVGVASSSKWKNKPMIMFDSGPCDWFVLPLLLPTPTTQFSLDHKRRSRKRNRNRKKWKRSDSSESDSVELMTPFTTPFFDFYYVTRSLTTPTPSLVKTSLKWYCESSPVYFLWQYAFRDTKITFQLLFIPVLFMCDSSLRTHPSLLLSLLLLLLLQYYYYYYIIIELKNPPIDLIFGLVCRRGSRGGEMGEFSPPIF